MACLTGCQVDLGVDGGRPESGGGGFLGTTTPTAQGLAPDGIWLGQTPDLAVTNINLFMHDGRLIMTGGGFIYFGSYPTDLTSGNISATVNVYSSGGIKLSLTPLTLAGNQTNATTLTLAVPAIVVAGTTVANPQTMNFTLQSDLWQRASSQNLIAYQWTIDIPSQGYHLEFPIAADGAITGAVDSQLCSYNGNINVIDPTKNFYAVAMTLEGAGCDPLTGINYSGLAALMPTDKNLLILVSNGTHAFPLELTRP